MQAASSWSFFDAHLTTATADWINRESPTAAQIDAFDVWCLDVTQTGPPADETIASKADPDFYVSYVETAAVLVSYLAIEQDRKIFVKRIARAR